MFELRIEALEDRLARRAALLLLIEKRRKATGCPALGASIERELIARELADLERQTRLDAAPAEPGKSRTV